MRAVLKISFGLAFIISLYACNKDKGPFVSGDGVNISEIDTVSYVAHIQPIFDGNCTSCHNTSHAKLDLQSTVSYNELLFDGFSASYVDTTNPENSNLYLHLTGVLSIMPPSNPLSLNEQELILLWIGQGSLNN